MARAPSGAPRKVCHLLGDKRGRLVQRAGMEESLEAINARLGPVVLVADALSEIAAASVRQLARRHGAKRKRGGETLRPGADTPLWNALVAEARPWLARRGEQALLARLLGVPRQRVHDFVVGRGRMPDAERTLLLLEWLAARRKGVRPG